MTYVLNNADMLPQQAAPAKAAPGFWQRLLAAVIESRTQSVMRELRARSYLIGESAIVFGDLPKTTHTTDGALPFNR
jgi:hypothetical protein